MELDILTTYHDHICNHCGMRHSPHHRCAIRICAFDLWKKQWNDKYPNVKVSIYDTIGRNDMIDGLIDRNAYLLARDRKNSIAHIHSEISKRMDGTKDDWIGGRKIVGEEVMDDHYRNRNMIPRNRDIVKTVSMIAIEGIKKRMLPLVESKAKERFMACYHDEASFKVSLKKVIEEIINSPDAMYDDLLFSNILNGDLSSLDRLTPAESNKMKYAVDAIKLTFFKQAVRRLPHMEHTVLVGLIDETFITIPMKRVIG